MRILIFAEKKEISEQLKSVIPKRYPGYFVEAVDCLKGTDLVKGKEFDIIFVDDGFGETSVSLAMFIQKAFPESKIIFITDSMETVSELLLNTEVFGIIEKSLNTSRVYRYLEAVKGCKDKVSRRFSFTERGRKRTILFSNIVYLESNREKLLIKAVKSEFGIWKKISDVEQLFPDYFVRCHNSFLVNMKYIVDYKNNSFILIDGSEIVISRSKKEEAVKKYCEYKDSIR